jgi:hypothetical protein
LCRTGPTRGSLPSNDEGPRPWVWCNRGPCGRPVIGRGVAGLSRRDPLVDVAFGGGRRPWWATWPPRSVIFLLSRLVRRRSTAGCDRSGEPDALGWAGGRATASGLVGRSAALVCGPVRRRQGAPVRRHHRDARQPRMEAPSRPGGHGARGPGGHERDCRTASDGLARLASRRRAVRGCVRGVQPRRGGRLVLRAPSLALDGTRGNSLAFVNAGHDPATRPRGVRRRLAAVTNRGARPSRRGHDPAAPFHGGQTPGSPPQESKPPTVVVTAKTAFFAGARRALRQWSRRGLAGNPGFPRGTTTGACR